jgi:hypothetical protein
MQITVEIPDELAARLQSLGVDLPSYVQDAAVSNAKEIASSHSEEKEIDLEAFFAGVSQHSAKMPVLSEEALHRPSYYQDHD